MIQNIDQSTMNVKLDFLESITAVYFGVLNLTCDFRSGMLVGECAAINHRVPSLRYNYRIMKKGSSHGIWEYLCGSKAINDFREVKLPGT